MSNKHTSRTSAKVQRILGLEGTTRATPVSPYIALERAIIVQALIDLTARPSRYNPSEKWRRDAKNWFQMKNPQFRACCDNASVSIECVLELVRNIECGNIVWNAPQGNSCGSTHRSLYNKTPPIKYDPFGPSILTGED